MLFSQDIGIDLGTANTLVFVKGKGIVIREPSVVAINVSERPARVVAVGTEAKEMIGRTPGSIVAVRPLKDGVIADFDITSDMLKEFIRRAISGSPFSRAKVRICIPSGVTSVERRAVHDAARCLITPQQISNVISVAAEHGAATAAAPMIDTVKKISFDKKIVATVDRRELILVQTPQVFNFKRFRDEVLNIEDFGSDITDDNMIYERAGYSVTAVYVGEENIKITTWRDMLFAELILKERMNG